LVDNYFQKVFMVLPVTNQLFLDRKDFLWRSFGYLFLSEF